MNGPARHMRIEQLRGLRWRGYVRESSSAQAEKWSPERQRSDIRRAADELGLVAAEPLWYERTGTGEAVSAELARALSDGTAGAYDVLLVLTTSRFARNRAEAVRMKALFQRAGVPVYFVMDRIVSGARSSSLLEGVREVIDEEEQETRRMWIAGGLRERALAGRWVGNIPFGYSKRLVDFPDGSRGWAGALEPDAEQAAVIRTIYARTAQGVSVLDIARDLNAAGVAGPRGPWRRNTVLEVVRNPVYKGVHERYRRSRPNRHYYPEEDATDGRRSAEAAWTPIIEPAMWDQIQKVLDHRRPSSGAKMKRLHYPLSGLLRCPNGHVMSGAHGNTSRYYRCAARARLGTCDAPFLRADEAEASFADWLREIRLPADWRTAIAATQEPLRDVARPKLLARLARIKNLYSWGDMGDEEYREESARIKDQLSSEVPPSISNMTRVAANLIDLGSSWDSAPAATKAAVARLMLHEITVRDGRVVAFVVHADLKPLLDLCVAPPGRTVRGQYRLRYA